jgi:hypothetical protein
MGAARSLPRRCALARTGAADRAGGGERVLPPVPGEDLGQGVPRVLREFGLPGAALELELTERVLVEDAPDTLAPFAELRRWA